MRRSHCCRPGTARSGRPTGIPYASVRLTTRQISGRSVPSRDTWGASVAESLVTLIRLSCCGTDPAGCPPRRAG
jgi:hypothetical protein